MHLFASLLHENRPLFLLAPLASLGHRGLRQMIHRHGGCDLFFSEMISAEALTNGANYESYYLEAGPEPARLVYQLVGAETESLTKAASLLLEHASRHEQTSGQSGSAGIDLNMGCSAPEMVRQGAGVHWMTQPDAARRLVAAIRPLVPSDKSLSVKIRIGEQEDFAALRHFCLGLEAEGLDFITFHPRLRQDPWARPARWQWFRQLADELRLPLVANGDIRDTASLTTLGETWRNRPVTSAAVTTTTWPAGIMIGRAAVRCPWIFRQLAELTGRQLEQAALPDSLDLLDTAREFHQFLELWQPRDFWLTRTKRFYAFFGLNLVYGHRVAAKIQSIAKYEKIFPYFEGYLRDNPVERWIKPR